MTYDELVQALQDWLEDSETEHVAEIPSIITMAEEHIFKKSPKHPIFNHKSSGSLTASTREFTLPDTGIRNIRNFHITVSGLIVFLDHRTSDFLEDYAPDTTVEGQPVFYSREDETTLYLCPTPDQAYSYTLRYRKLPTGLSSGNQNTFISDNHGDLLKFTALHLSAEFVKMREAADRFKILSEEKLELFSEETAGEHLNEYNSGLG